MSTHYRFTPIARRWLARIEKREGKRAVLKKEAKFSLP
jgi:hypothetical protein